MSLAEITKIETFAYTGESPWGSLGTKVEGNLSSTEMLNAAGLNWTVSKEPMYIGDNQVVKDRHALVRDSDREILDVVGKGWMPTQNVEAFDFFHEFVDAGKMTMDTAGSLDNGRIVWALAKVGEGFNIFGGDQVDPYLLFVNPHKYGKSIDVRFTPIRVSCQNSLSYALSKEAQQQISVGHRSNFSSNKVKEILGLTNLGMDHYKENAIFLGSKRFNDETLSNYLHELFNVDKEEKLSRPARQIMSVMDTQPGVEFAEGSWWQAVNAVTFYADHMAGRSDNGRMKSAWFGPNRTMKNNAMQLATEYAEAA